MHPCSLIYCQRSMSSTSSLRYFSNSSFPFFAFPRFTSHSPLKPATIMLFPLPRMRIIVRIRTADIIVMIYRKRAFSTANLSFSVSPAILFAYLFLLFCQHRFSFHIQLRRRKGFTALSQLFLISFSTSISSRITAVAASHSSAQPSRTLHFRIIFSRSMTSSSRLTVYRPCNRSPEYAYLLIVYLDTPKTSPASGLVYVPIRVFPS